MTFILHVCVAGQGLYSSSVYAFTDFFFFLSWSHVHLKALVLSLGWNASNGVVKSSIRGFLEAVFCSSELHKRWALGPVRCCYILTVLALWCLVKQVIQAAIRKGFFGFLMFCLPSEGTGYLFNILSSDLKKGCAQTSLSQLYQLVLYILVLPTFIFITAFLHVCFQLHQSASFCAEVVKSVGKVYYT